MQTAPFAMSETPAANFRPSPRIGEHTREVLERLLNFTVEDVRAGFEDGTLWPGELERFPYLDEMLR